MLGLPAYAYVYSIPSWSETGAPGASSPIYQTTGNAPNPEIYNYSDMISKGVWWDKS